MKREKVLPREVFCIYYRRRCSHRNFRKAVLRWWHAAKDSIMTHFGRQQVATTAFNCYRQDFADCDRLNLFLSFFFLSSWQFNYYDLEATEHSKKSRIYNFELFAKNREREKKERNSNRYADTIIFIIFNGSIHICTQNK